MYRPRYLLDTNILSDLIRHPAGKVARRIEDLGEAAICTSIIVAGELRFGAVHRGSPGLASKVEQLLVTVPVLPLERGADRYYADIRAHLSKAGQLIGPNDLLIAAHALARDLTLVTANEREFARVSGLAVENWLAPGG